jgi:hypothetical protein
MGYIGSSAGGTGSAFVRSAAVSGSKRQKHPLQPVDAREYLQDC